jgi:hypothetical protein
MLRTIFLLATFGLSVFADEASRLVKAEQFMQVAQMDKMLNQSMTMMREQMKSSTMREIMTGGQVNPAEAKRMDELQQKINGALSDIFTWEKLKPAYAKLYADAFTDEELDGLIAFYKSPAGQAFVTKTPQVMQQSMGIVQKLMAEAQPRLKR